MTLTVGSAGRCVSMESPETHCCSGVWRQLDGNAGDAGAISPSTIRESCSVGTLSTQKRPRRNRRRRSRNLHSPELPFLAQAGRTGLLMKRLVRFRREGNPEARLGDYLEGILTRA